MTSRSSSADGDGDSASPAERPLRVLVVDDLVDAATTMARLLHLLSCEVQIAHDGESGLQLAAQFAPDVILLDIGLPGMDGYEVARRLRAQNISPGAMIVALSGYGHQAARETALEAGCDQHLLKPVGIDALQAVLAQRRGKPA